MLAAAYGLIWTFCGLPVGRNPHHKVVQAALKDPSAE
jgi:hypothetical protein